MSSAWSTISRSSSSLIARQKAKRETVIRVVKALGLLAHFDKQAVFECVVDLNLKRHFVWICEQIGDHAEILAKFGRLGNSKSRASEG